MPSSTEHVQLKTMYCMNCVKYVHPRHLTFSCTHLLPFLNDVLPAMVLQNRVVWSNIKCPSPHSSVWHVSLNPAPTVPTGLGRRVVGVVVLLLLLMSGDIEMNPGPVGKRTSSMYKAYSMSLKIHSYKKQKYTYHMMNSIDGSFGHFWSGSVFSCVQNTG